MLNHCLSEVIFWITDNQFSRKRLGDLSILSNCKHYINMKNMASKIGEGRSRKSRGTFITRVEITKRLSTQFTIDAISASSRKEVGAQTDFVLITTPSARSPAPLFKQCKKNYILPSAKINSAKRNANSVENLLTKVRGEAKMVPKVDKKRIGCEASSYKEESALGSSVGSM